MVTDSYISGRCRYRHAPVKASTTSVQYAYSDPNDNSRLTSMTYPNGRILICGYNDNALDDAIGRLDYLADAGGAMAGHLADYQYVGLSTPVSQAFANGVTENITFTNFGQTAEVNYVNTSTSTSTDDFAYGYDADGNVLYKNNMLSPASSELYHANSTTTGDDNSAYDPLNRLVAFARGTLSASGDNGSSLDTVASASATQNWSLNAVGDQSSVTTNGTTTSNATNSQNQLTGFGSVGLAYDNNGDTTTDENGHSLVYDAWSRLVSVSSGSTLLATYSYDGTGRRVTEAENSVTTDLYYSNQWQVLEERQSGTVTAQYVWGPFYVNQIVLRDSNPTSLGELGITSSGLSLRVYFQQDANWNVTAVTDVSGSVLMRLEYSAYGVATVLNADWSTGTAPFGSADAYGVVYGFQGGRYDPASGKINFQERYYDAVTAAWGQQDPARIGTDVYLFCGNSPIDETDPTGLWSDTNPPTGWKNQPSTRPAAAQSPGFTLEICKVAERIVESGSIGLGIIMNEAGEIRLEYDAAVKALEQAGLSKAEASAARDQLKLGFREKQNGLGRALTDRILAARKAAGVVAKKNSPFKPNAGLFGTAKLMKVAGKGLVIVGLTLDIIDVATSDEPAEEAGKKGGALLGAIAGAEAGALIGAWGGPWGAGIGAFVGGAAGAYVGEEAVAQFLNSLKNPGQGAPPAEPGPRLGPDEFEVPEGIIFGGLYQRGIPGIPY